jgi:uncharacterized protein YbjT (DUF2867 family)
MNKTVIVAGATGLVGRHLVNFLEQDPQVEEIHILSRRGWDGPHKKVGVHPANFGGGLSESLLGLRPDAVFSCLGTTIKVAGSQKAFRSIDHDAVIEVAALAKQQGAQTFLTVSALGASASSLVFYNRVKGETEDDLKVLGFRSCYVLRPSLLLGDREVERGGEKIGETVLTLVKPFLMGPFRKYQAITAERVAERLWRLSKAPEAGFHVIENDRI